MNLKNYIFYIFFIFLISCKGEKSYIPNALTKLSESEVIERAKNKIFFDYKKVTYKNEDGKTVTLDYVEKIQYNKEFTSDRYVDGNGEVKIIVIRKATQKDKEFQAKLLQAYSYEPPIEIIDIDCTSKSVILEEIFALDQNMRLDEDFNPVIDKQNLIKIISLIEKCGMPTLKEVSKKQINAIWLVFQHADNINRKKYFPILKKSAKNGDLSKSKIALMEDRILMMDGKPQIYGSQIITDSETGEWILYNLQNPKTVDKRRLKVGLGSLKEYVSHWNIEFNIKQTE